MPQRHWCDLVELLDLTAECRTSLYYVKRPES
jgi:hypothetical protein